MPRLVTMRCGGAEGVKGDEMSSALRFKESSIQLLFKNYEFDEFRQLVHDICEPMEDILGVLITGSLVQRCALEDPPSSTVASSRLCAAYADIVGRSKRKLFPHLLSDLDVWVLTREQPGNEWIGEELDKQALELLRWYASRETVDLSEWIERKNETLGRFYKQPYLYSYAWCRVNRNPSHADMIRIALEAGMQSHLPQVVRKIKYYFKTPFEGGFFEVRAFPPSVFNLKTERIELQGTEDRTPFPFYIRDWIDITRNCMVLYRRPGEDTIYPFQANGRIPGQKLADTLCWTTRHIDWLLYQNQVETRGA